ncbi:NACHT, LRR and PYD domains-containing protein 1b allele 4-like [Aquarana catesbeiana]|uniref:NACHT, LRR and PYD domains-containing protein 1b allele 4-like n=1 Tax=Aquarana catesbeiana TaxID=8400 RepID=UPI003CC92500
MKSLFLEPSSDILSDKMARADLKETTPEFSTLTEEDNAISPSIHGIYRRKLEPGQLFCCSETGIKFQVKSPVTIEYELEYGKNYMKQIKDSGYELVGPLFNITVKPGVVSSVHLPHYFYLEEQGKTYHPCVKAVNLICLTA